MNGDCKLESNATFAASDVVDTGAGATSGLVAEPAPILSTLVAADSSSCSPWARSLPAAERGDGASSDTKSSNALRLDSVAGGDSSDISESDCDNDCDKDADATRVGSVRRSGRSASDDESDRLNGSLASCNSDFDSDWLFGATAAL